MADHSNPLLSFRDEVKRFFPMMIASDSVHFYFYHLAAIILALLEFLGQVLERINVIARMRHTVFEPSGSGIFLFIIRMLDDEIARLRDDELVRLGQPGQPPAIDDAASASSPPPLLPPPTAASAHCAKCEKPVVFAGRCETHRPKCAMCNGTDSSVHNFNPNGRNCIWVCGGCDYILRQPCVCSRCSNITGPSPIVIHNKGNKPTIVCSKACVRVCGMCEKDEITNGSTHRQRISPTVPEAHNLCLSCCNLIQRATGKSVLAVSKEELTEGTTKKGVTELQRSALTRMIALLEKFQLKTK